MHSRHQIICFGETLIDMLAQPSADADMPHAFLPFAGGAPANVAVAVAKLGGHSQFVGMLGEDMFGDFLLQRLEQAGVGTAAVARTGQARTTLAFVALDAQGERSFSFYRNPGADMLFRPAHFAQVDFAAARVFHVCSITMSEDAIADTTLAGMRRARMGGALVSFDINLRPMLWPAGTDPAPRISQALALADIVKCSQEEFDWLRRALSMSATELIAHLWQGPAQLLLISDGARQPLRWQTRGHTGEVPTFAVKACDTTAAGDACVAGLLYQLGSGVGAGMDLKALCQEPALLRQCLRFAAAVGALAVTRRGAFSAMPTLDEVLTLMQQQPLDDAQASREVA